MPGSMEPDLAYILDSRRVPQHIIDKLDVGDVSSVADFAGMAESRSGIRRFLVDVLGVTAADTVADHLAAARFIEAWEASRKRTEVRVEVEAEARVRKPPVELPSPEHKLILRAVEALVGMKIDKAYTPSHHFLEMMHEEIQNMDFRAVRLGECLSVEEENVDGGDLIGLGRDGNMRIRRGKQGEKPPRDAEEMRKRITILAYSFLCVKTKLPNTLWLEGFTMSCAEEHIRYLLGENVAGLVARDPEGREVSRPTLTEIGHYEWCTRKRAFRFIEEESDTLKDALVKAREDAVTKERSFTTTLAAQSWAAAAAWS